MLGGIVLKNEIDESYKDNLIVPGSERAILSICLKNPEKIVECDEEGLSDFHFGVDAHRYIYVAMQYLYSKKQTPNAISITEVITSKEGKKALEEMGGLAYLSTFEKAFIPEDNIKIFCDKIKQYYTKRYLYETCIKTQNDLLNTRTDTMNENELVGLIESRITDFSLQINNKDDVYKMGSETERILKERAENPSQIPGLETGWVKFDSLTGGLCAGDLIFICARSKTGKSVLLTNWASELAVKQNLPLLYIDTEMSSRDQEDRLLSILSGIPEREITSGMYVLDTVNGKAKDKIERLKYATKKLHESNYYHIYTPSYDFDKINGLTRSFKRKENICALFFDYLKLTQNQAKNMRATQEYQELGFIAGGLKDLAGILKIPIVSACQENRGVGDKSTKDETNVGGSDRILQNASKLIFLVNKTDEQLAKEGILRGNQKLIIKFQRKGECDCEPIDVMFNRPIITMNEV